MIGSFKSSDHYSNVKNRDFNSEIEKLNFNFSDFRDIVNSGKFAVDNPETIKNLVPKLEKALDGDFKLKFAAISALRLISKVSPKEIVYLVPKIAELLNNNDWRVRKNAIEFMGDFGLICYSSVKTYFENLKNGLNDSNVEVVSASAYAISKIMINSKCTEKVNLSEILRSKITSKPLLMEVIKNISEVNPDAVNASKNDVFYCIDSEDLVLKSKAIKILGDFKDFELDQKTAKILISSLSEDNLEVNRSSVYAIWKYSEKYPEYLKDSIDILINHANSKDKYLKIYSLLALNKLSYLEPFKFERLNINSLLDEDLDVVYPSMTLLYNLSLYSPKSAAKHYKKVCILMNSGDINVSRQALRIIGNLGKYDQKYIYRYINNIRLKLNDENLAKEAALSMVKSGQIDRKVVEVILKAVDKAKNNMEFLRSVIEEYPKNLLYEMNNEVKNRKRNSNKEYIEELCYIINEKLSSHEPDVENFQVERPEIEEPPVIVALKSECSEVELEDGKQVYILPKEKCVETSLSGELLEILETDSKKEFELYRLSHDLMIQSLIESTLKDQKKYF